MVLNISNTEDELSLLNEAFTENWNVPESLLADLLELQFPLNSESVKDFIKKSPSQFSLLKLAVKCFDEFLRANWTGPTLDTPCFVIEESENLLTALSVDGEEVYAGCLHKELLRGAITILDILNEISSFQTISIWRSRAYFVWQRVLSDSNDRGQGNCPTLMAVCLTEYVSALETLQCIPTDLFADLKASVSTIGTSPCLRQISLPSLPMNLQAELVLELVVRLLYYGKSRSVRGLLDLVATWLKVSINVTGVEGIKRQYQTVAFAQMAARVIRLSNETNAEVQDPSVEMPASLLLAAYDPTTDILEEVCCEPGTSNLDELNGPLSALEQCLLIGEALVYWYSGNSRDELNLESVHALGVRIIAGHKKQIGVWTPFSTSLLFRSRSEFFKNSTRGRACFQTDTLVAQYADPEPRSRLAFLHATGYPSLWELQRENGTRMMEVGMVVTACEMFKKLQMWPLVMDCLAVAGRKSEALDLLAELETTKGPLSARLLCSKGDMTGDSQFYQQAWEQSGRRNARAQRSLGRVFMTQKNFENAAKSFELSLQINPLFDDIWFSLGSIYLQLANTLEEEEATLLAEKAMNAFVHCVSINPEHVQAWVNLSAVYQRFPDKLGEAKNAAAEAVKLSPQAWQFWDNFGLICARARDWQNVVRAELKLSIGPLARPDRPDMNMVHAMAASDFGSTPRMFEFLETLVANNKGAPCLLALLAQLYTDKGDFVKAMNTRSLQLKELLSACTSEAQDLQSHFDSLQECLAEIAHFVKVDKSLALLTGLKLTVRSIPRRVAAANGGTALPHLDALCSKIEEFISAADAIQE